MRTRVLLADLRDPSDEVVDVLVVVPRRAEHDEILLRQSGARARRPKRGRARRCRRQRSAASEQRLVGIGLGRVLAGGDGDAHLVDLTARAARRQGAQTR